MGNAVLALLLFLQGGNAAALPDAPETVEGIEVASPWCRITFDPVTGALRSIINARTGDEYLKEPRSGAMPFRLYTDLTREFSIGQNEKFQLVFDAPEAIAGTVVHPGTCRLVEVRRDHDLTLRYEEGGLETELRVTLAEEAGASDWSLRVTNTGEGARKFLVGFPYLDGVRLGPNPANNLATAMDQAGLVVPAWERSGGVLGESNQLSMQWHAVWDPESGNAVGLLFMDADVRPKRLELSEPRIELHHFPPVALAPGESVELPRVRLLVYQGDWRPAARAYGAWYAHAYPHVEPPAWFRQSDGLSGIHVGIGSSRLESLRDLPRLHLRTPQDALEYAFYCQGSVGHDDVHTDGDNVIREDLGGAAAMRDGIAGVHRLGLHVTLYVEGFIVHKDSQLAATGRARRWSVMHRDGSATGPYSKNGFLHMCPGCEEWQDHLAGVVARLLRETGADGIRLDSLGFYYLPCYNPAHGHASPFDYNEWIKQLLAKVRAAAIAVKPDVLLLTEGSADWFGPWFHGALTARCPRDLPPMRLAVSPFRNYVYACGALWGSLSGYAGGGCGGPDTSTMDWNWACARLSAGEALVWGDVRDDGPRCADPEIVARCFEGEGYWAVVAARPACQEAIWPWGTGPSEQRHPYTLTLPGLASEAQDAALCDVETLTWTPLPLEREGGDVRFELATNWALVVLRRAGGPALAGFGPLPKLARGASATLDTAWLLPGTPDAEVEAVVRAPGLEVALHDGGRVPGRATLTAPVDALPGSYGVTLSGRNLLGMKRFVVVE